jgi:hypothetical protein
MPWPHGGWLGLSVAESSEADLLAAEIAVAVMERHNAATELAAIQGGQPSPADVSAYLAMPPKARRAANFQLAVLMASPD